MCDLLHTCSGVAPGMRLLKLPSESLSSESSESSSFSVRKHHHTPPVGRARQHHTRQTRAENDVPHIPSMVGGNVPLPNHAMIEGAKPLNCTVKRDSYPRETSLAVLHDNRTTSLPCAFGGGG